MFDASYNLCNITKRLKCGSSLLRSYFVVFVKSILVNPARNALYVAIIFIPLSSQGFAFVLPQERANFENGRFVSAGHFNQVVIPSEGSKKKKNSTDDCAVTIHIEPHFFTAFFGVAVGGELLFIGGYFLFDFLRRRKLIYKILHEGE